MDTSNFKEVFTSDEVKQLRQRVAELEKEPSVESGGEFKTWWEIALHVGAWKNHELDYVHFGSEMAVRAFAIHLLKQRDKEESQLIQTIAKLTAERVQELEKELEVERMRLVACSTAALGYFNGCCDEYKSASLADVLGLRESNEKLTAERDALKQQRDELLAAAEAIEIDAEECLDFDEFTAMLVPIDTFHKLMEAITSIKDGTNVQD